MYVSVLISFADMRLDALRNNLSNYNAQKFQKCEFLREKKLVNQLNTRDVQFHQLGFHDTSIHITVVYISIIYLLLVYI